MMRLLAAALIFLTCLSDASAQRKRRPVPTPLTRACGSEVAWAADVESALATARQQKRPVFWYVPTVRGSRMDRKPEIDLYMMSGPFSAPDVVSILNRKMVPVKQVPRGAVQEKYGLHHLKFIEPGFLVLAPDGEVIKKVDKITTLSAEWFCWQLNEALARRPALNHPSSETVAAILATKNGATGDVTALVRSLIADGDLEAAEKAARQDSPEAKPPVEMLVLRARIARRLRKETEAESYLKSIGNPGGWTPEALTEFMRLALARDMPKKALEAYRRGEGHANNESHFLRGVALHLENREKEAQATWKKLTKSEADDAWTRKAGAELQRLGPFARAFEAFDRLPDDAFVKDPDGTRVPRGPEKGTWLAQRSVRILLAHQRSNGSWDDSNYDFGGTDSLPNVYVAGTALAAVALMEWRSIDPSAIDASIERALTFLLDEDNLANDDKDEIVWAHAYRLIFFDHYIRYPAARRQADARKKAREVVRHLVTSQLDNGSWRHEYPNPMATASVVHALERIKQGARVPVGKDTLDRAGAALALCRSEDGTFSYGMPGRRRRRPPQVEASAGRMPLCELALLFAGRSGQEKLRNALDKSFEHHHRLEAIRKYDDHADAHGNGGFFFWYDMYGRLEAIKAVKDMPARKAYLKQMLELTLALPEIDGGFVDSHELGKTYGTAMGLLSLALTLPARE